MKKALLYILAVILLCGVTVSCSKNNEEEPVSQETVETIIMFFPYSRLESAIRQNIEDIEACIKQRGGLANKRIFAIPATNNKISDIYEIKYSNGKCLHDTIARKVSTNFSSYNQNDVVSTIQSMLSQVKAYAPAKTYSMIIGCHGSGWLPAGITLNDCNSGYLASKSAAPRKAFGTASQEGQIDNSSLASALSNIDMHLNYILFDACYMATIEGIYELRDVTDYVIASQNEILSAGIPYTKVSNALLNHDYEKVVDEYYNFYNNYTYNNISYQLGSLSVTDTKYLDQVASIIKNINNGNINTDIDLKTVQKMDSISKNLFYDLGDYFKKSCTNTSLLNNLNDKLALLVPYKKSTQYVFSAFPRESELRINTYCGISTSQPTTNSVAAPYLKKTKWWIATH